jgi:polyhydroxyalkanoate synthesis repressor PhaR
MAKKTVVIKKYENRRLYDTTNSRYVNLEEVAQLLQQGNDVQVVDATTNEDITRLILTQIIVEDAKTPNSSFPLDLLRQMVIASGRAGQESTLKYMKAMLDIYQNTYRAMAPPLNPFDFMQNLRTDRDVPREERRAAASEASSGAQSEAGRPDSDEVKELKRRLAELERLVSSLVPGKS